MKNDFIYNYIKSAVNFLRSEKECDISSFFLLYFIILGQQYIPFGSLVNSKTINSIDLYAVRQEAIQKLNASIFSEWVVLPVHASIIKWLVDHPPIETTHDILGDIYLLYSEDKQRKKMGEHYTRPDLVEHIFDELKISGTKHYRLIDPACGSGNFLIEMVRRRLNYCKTIEDKLEMCRKVLLGNVIVGIDIQSIPCLISKVRLLIEILRCTKTLNPETSPPIYRNNSLLDEHVFLRNDQYDIVITNPPYLRFQSIEKELRNNYKQGYISATGRFDLYTLFIEKAIKLVKPYGKVVILCSDKFMSAAYGKGIRDFVKQNARLETIIDLSSVFPFQSNVISAVYIFSKGRSANEHNPVWKKSIINQGRFYSSILGEVSTANNWRYINSSLERVFEKIINLDSVTFLGKISKRISVGLQSTADKVLCKPMTIDFIEKNCFEKELLIPILRGRNLKKWSYQWKPLENKDDVYILYPYIKDGKETRVVEIEKYPEIYKYLLKHKEILKNRYYLKQKSKQWFEHWEERSFACFEKAKIITPDLALNNTFSLDTSGFFVNGTVYFINLLDHYTLDDYKYLLGILNSKTMLFFHKYINPLHLNAKRYRFQTSIMKQYPIIMLSSDDRRYKEIVESVNRIIRCQGIDCSDIESIINTQVYGIYDLNSEEVEIIEQYTSNDLL